MVASGPIGGKRGGAFFGRRKGYRLRPRQSDLLAVLLPQLALDLDGPVPSDLRALFTPSIDEIRMEIGFGGGEYLVAEAVRHSQTGFIGIEPFVNGMAKALAAIAERNLRNIRLHHGDAIEVMAWLRGNGREGNSEIAKIRPAAANFTTRAQRRQRSSFPAHATTLALAA